MSNRKFSAGATNHTFLPERDYVTFGSLLSQIRLSSVTSVTLLRRLNLSAIFLHRCVPWPSSDVRAKFYGYRPRGTPPVDCVKRKMGSKIERGGRIERLYPINGTVQDRRIVSIKDE